MAISFADAARVPPIPYNPPRCGVFNEARRKFNSGEMTVEQAIKWIESQPGWAPAPNCRCETCGKAKNET